MCGIAGMVDFARDVRTLRAVTEAMTETMAPRGPDAVGVWDDEHVALGHRRLAVIDIEGGVQPMVAEREGAVVAALTFSGEIYNFRELRAELETRGHRFRTRSDTEVVLVSYLEWGPQCADRLNGMFAFAVWDAVRDELVLVRDRMGVKPLYFAPTGDGVLFGSEPKAILAHPDFDPVVDADGLRQLLSRLKVPGSSPWRGMHEVRPGWIVTASRAGVRQQCYWRLEARDHTDDIPTTVRTVRELLDDIVGRQLVSDVPLCTLLSGGLDSSALTALAAGKLLDAGEDPVRTFSVDFTGQAEALAAAEWSRRHDTPYVHEVAERVGSVHTDIVLASSQLLEPEARRAVVRARDLPLGGGDFDTSLYLLFRAIRERSTVALSGESADEVFGGYAWFHSPRVLTNDTFPWMARRQGAGWLPLLRRDVVGELDLAAFVADQYASARAEVPHVAGASEVERKMREVCYLALTRFVTTLLDRKDRMSMANGLEVRVPFCDHRLVEYVFNTPWAMKTFDGREKSLLRAATADLLPASVLERRKSPYPTTRDPDYGPALRAELRASAGALDGPVAGLVDAAAVRRVVSVDRPRRARMLRSAIERVLVWQRFCEEYEPVLTAV